MVCSKATSRPCGIQPAVGGMPATGLASAMQRIVVAQRAGIGQRDGPRLGPGHVFQFFVDLHVDREAGLRPESRAPCAMRRIDCSVLSSRS